MLLIREGRYVAALAVAWAGLVGGCRVYNPAPPVEKFSAIAIKTDPAMMQRQWPLTRAQYANDQVTAEPTLLTVATEPEGQLANAGGDWLLFMGNVVMMPYEYFAQQGWEPMPYKSMRMEDSYTGVPPLPPSPAPRF